MAYCPKHESGQGKCFCKDKPEEEGSNVVQLSEFRERANQPGGEIDVSPESELDELIDDDTPVHNGGPPITRRPDGPLGN